jgi:ABC-2 type transport system permease protein
VTTIDLPPRPVSPIARLRSAFADGLTIVVRDLIHLRRAPGQVVGMLVFPIIMVVMFGYVFGSAISVPGGQYREYLLPGLFVMTSVTSVMATSQLVASDIQRGVMDRFRSMPMVRSAVPFGQTGVDAIGGTVALILMACCGLAVGWRVHTGVGKTIAGFGLLVLLRYAIAWGGVLLGAAVKNEETVDHMTPLIFPVTMIANTFVPTSGMPAWLRTISNWNPVSAAVAACRQLWGDAGASTTHTSLPLEHPVLATLAWSLLMLLVFVPLSVHRFRTANR